MTMLILAALFALAAPALAQDTTRVDVFTPDGQRKGHAIIDEKTGRVDTYAPDSRRTGYGVIQPDGRVERYRLDGTRKDHARPSPKR